MEIIEKDITTIQTGIIVHQVNNKGVMGGGVALAIRKKYPQHFNDYLNNCNKHSDNNLQLLGKCTMTHINSNLWVIGIFSQAGLGYGKCFTNYSAMEKCFKRVKILAEETGLKVYLPYLIGCYRGGGDWNKVIKLIEKYLPNAILCKYTE